MISQLKRLLWPCYWLILVLFSVYSYSQVDLNLTLSSNTTYLAFQKVLTQLGYFQRPASTLIYIVLLLSLLLSYFFLVHQSKNENKKFSKYIKIMLIIAFVGIVSFPAFSYDIFNYIFDARIFVEHGQNPYTHMALDFPEDTWTRFMRWTHRTYPYGPTWLPISIVTYSVGLGKFLLTLLSFKILAALSYLIGGWGVYTISNMYQKQHIGLAMTLYMCNPLIFIEGLMNAHLDMVMAGVMLGGMALVLKEHKNVGWITLCISAAIKYVSACVLVPLVLFKRSKVSYQNMIRISLVLSYILTIIVISQREILPWYVLVPFALTVLDVTNRFTRNLMYLLMPALLLRYAPFLYIGEYSDFVYRLRNQISFVVLFVGLVLIYVISVQKRVPKK